MHDIHPRLGVVIAVSIGGLAIAGWKLGVAPLHQQLATANASCGEMERQIRELEALALPEQASLDADLALATQHRERLKSIGAAPDGNRIQERLRTLAAEWDVKIDRLERRNKLGGAENKHAAYSARETVGFTMSVRGSYSNVAGYVRAVAADHGLTRINTLRLTPVAAQEGQAVSASIETSHLRLVAPRAKDGKQGDSAPGASKPAGAPRETRS
ncbi:MAG: hypothetical protein AMXMBFR58_34810 [Phycisphaerae bacterium]|nr:hypothetical protein [Phycisphaerales bacterium]